MDITPAGPAGEKDPPRSGRCAVGGHACYAVWQVPRDQNLYCAQHLRSFYDRAWSSAGPGEQIRARAEDAGHQSYRRAHPWGDDAGRTVKGE